MNKPISRFCLITIAAIAAISCTALTKPSVGDVQVVLLAGQSNMSGAGNFNALDDKTKARIERVSRRVMVSHSGQPPQPLSYKISRHHEQKYGFSATFGPELFIGLTLAESQPKAEFLLIKTAHGGTALYGAWSPEWTAEKALAVENTKLKQTTRFFDLHMSQIRENLERLQRQKKQYRISGMTWMQGENDAAKEISARSYEKNLRKLINAYRSDLNQPKMPFVIGQINSTYGKFPAGPEMVRAAMVRVADTVPNTFLIETSTDTSWADYPKHSDNTHYNTEGQKRLGIAFANALQQLDSDKQKKN